MIDKVICDEGFNWNPSNWEYEFDKSCGVGEYLDYKNCKCRKRLVDNSVEECNENIDEKDLHSTELHSNKMIYNKTLNDYRKICGYCTIYIVLFTIFFMIRISISTLFIYFYWYLKSNTNITNIKYSTETTIY